LFINFVDYNIMMNSEKPQVSAVYYLLLMLLASFTILLIIFLIQYIRLPCGPTGKMNYLQYLMNLDPNSSPCNLPVPEQDYEEREVKDEREVFHINDQIYTFLEAKEKCKAYDADLANYQQIVDAYNNGAEWTSYGWSKGVNAYYPIQPCSYVKLRRQGIKVGPPGVNGGRFRPKLRFGANCYGIKPAGKVVNPKPPICKDLGESIICQKNPLACKKLDGDRVDPFVRDEKWSQWDKE
jgi:hypothetical protein